MSNGEALSPKTLEIKKISKNKVTRIKAITAFA